MANIEAVINGHAWGAFEADGIKKRLVSLKRHAADNWTFILVPWEQGVGWSWHPKISWHDLAETAAQEGARVIDLERYGTSDELFSAILLHNAP